MAGAASTPRTGNPSRRGRRSPIIAAVLAFLATSAIALAAPADVKREELKDLQGRIRTLQKGLAKAEESRADAAEELREAEQAISEANRALRELGLERAEAQSRLDQLKNHSQQFSGRIATQQAQLGRLYTRQYYAGESDTLRHLLSGNDPNQLARDAHFLNLLSRAKAGLIRGLGEMLEENRRLAAQAREKSEALAEIERRQQQARAGLLEQQKKRQAMLVRLSEKIQAQRSEVDRLKRDEKRLGRLIEGLGRIAARPKAPAGNRKPALGNERPPDRTRENDAFARLKGRLSLPAPGELAGRFGTPREGGGATWKGVFIRAAGGTEVKAVAPGRIAFADWLRGFGNLIIVDHGGGYLSVYGSNESLYKTVGQDVRGGETIAAVGNSGGNPETGLYFELRHLGQALDPSKWIGQR